MARPRKHAAKDILQASMGVFWENGYDQTTTSDLERATGVQRGSLYNTFGDKRGLYLAVLDHYGAQEMGAGVALFVEGPTAQEAARKLFDAAACAACDTPLKGCLLCDAAIEQATKDPEIADRAQHWITTLRDAIDTRLRSDTPNLSAQDATARANAAVASYYGMKVLTKVGADQDHLQTIADQAVAALAV